MDIDAWPTIERILSYIAIFLMGLLPYIFTRKPQQDRRIDLSKYVEKEDLEAYKIENKHYIEIIKEFVKNANSEIMRISTDVMATSREIREHNDKDQREMREEQRISQIENDHKVDILHQRSQDTEIVIATFDGRLKTLEQNKRD